jgi:hypothetical protein
MSAFFERVTSATATTDAGRAPVGRQWLAACRGGRSRL